MNKKNEEEIYETNQRTRKCMECPFIYDKINGRNKELLKSNGNKVLFIGHSPSPAKKGEQRFMMFLKSLVEQTDISWEETSYTSLCKLEIPPGQALSAKQLRHCTRHLVEEVVALEPEMIITLGTLARTPFNTKFGEASIVEFIKANDQELVEKTLNIPVMSLRHPGSIRYGVISEQLFTKQLNNAYHVGHRQN